MTSLLFGDLFNWKLHTPGDYLNFFLLLFGSLAILLVYFKWRGNRRTKKVCSRRTAKKLRKYLPKGTLVLTNATFDHNGQHFSYDNLAVGDFGIVAVENVPRGVAAYGEPRSETWKVTGHQQDETMPNPVLKLERTFPTLQSYLASKDVFNVPLDTLVIFCDDFDTPRFYLGRTTNVLVPKQLKEFCGFKKSSPKPGFDPQALRDAISAVAVEAPFQEEPKKQKKTKAKQ